MRRETLPKIELVDALTDATLLGISVELRNIALVDYVSDAVMEDDSMDFCGRVSVGGEELLFRGMHADFRQNSDYLEYWVSKIPVFMQGTMMSSPDGEHFIQVDYTNWENEY